MSLVRIDWHPTPSGLRKFGVSMIVGFGLIGGAFLAGWPVGSHIGLGIGLWIAGVVIGVIGLSGTKAAIPFYWAWMGVAFVLGNVMSRLVLLLVYYLVFTPMGLAMRLLGHDPLVLRKRNVDTYWTDIKPVKDRSQYERQF